MIHGEQGRVAQVLYLRDFMRTPGGLRVTMSRSEYLLEVRVFQPPFVGQPHGVTDGRPPEVLPFPAGGAAGGARGRREARISILPRCACRAASVLPCAQRVPWSVRQEAGWQGAGLLRGSERELN